MFRGRNEGRRARPDEQSLHDRVVKRLAAQKRARHIATYANPGQERHADVAGLYPDVLVVDERTRAPRSILLEVWEVETVESVSESEAANEWLPFARMARECDAEFHLLVPPTSVGDAVRLCALYEVDCNIWSFRETPTRLRLERHTE
jgi:hypothetical protein